MTATTYIVSDLHIGDGVSYRDNFSYRDKRVKFNAFLDLVGKDELLILGDCFEFWQANIDLDIIANEQILNRLAEMDVHYIAGNHDADLSHFYEDKAKGFPKFLNHRFFLEKSRKELRRDYGGKRFLFLHGHEGDEYNDKPAPDFGRAVTIIAGMLEDRIKSRYIWRKKEKIPLEATLTQISDTLLWLIEGLSSLLTAAPAGKDAVPAAGAVGELQGALAKELTTIDKEKLTPAEKQRKMADAVQERFAELLRDAAEKVTTENGADGTLSDTMGGQGPRHKFLPEHLGQMNKLWKTFAGSEWDSSVLVVGHTHMPGVYGSRYRNSGSWSDLGEDVLTLDQQTGGIKFYTWGESGLVEGEPEDFSKVVPGY